MSEFVEQARERILQAAAARTPLRIRGSGSKDFYGGALLGEVLDTRAHRGIVAYDPSELVLVVKAGTRLAEVEAALAARDQMLAFEPPQFGPDATVGGCVAAGLSGPRRMQAGALRDFLLGATLMDGRGDVLRFGGQVMKNVAGFDTFRLQAGAMGTLGLLLELSFKVLPRPEAETTRVFECDAAAAIEAMNRHAGQPLPITAAAHLDGLLRLRLSGNAAAVAAAEARLGGQRDDEGAAFWNALREQQLPFFVDGEAPLWRLAVKSTTQPLAALGAELIDWSGAQRWLRSGAEAATIRAQALQSGGHATRFRRGAVRREDQAFQPLSPALLALHRGLKQSFDPAGIFNPRRLLAEF
ncbi:MAG: glycolate oxidase subunit GlcE [Nevskia sp.]